MIIIFVIISLNISISSLIHLNKIENTKEFILQYLQELDRFLAGSGSGDDQNKKDLWKFRHLYIKKALEKRDTLDYPGVQLALREALSLKLENTFTNETIIKEVIEKICRK